MESMDERLITAIWTVYALFAGSLVTWLVTWLYYKKAGDELKRETMVLRKLNSLGLRLLAKDLKARLGEDEHGEITGIIEELKGTGKVGFTGTAHLTVTQETAGFGQGKSASHAEAGPDLPENEPGSNST